ncbi:MAG: hypothetical protein HQK72_05420 [Desulfamplus sp.]|nr:hypothetical protein [Desulfamplus sp.]
MKEIETINEIRKVRKEISQKFNYDPKCLIQFYKETQKKRIPVSYKLKGNGQSENFEFTKTK